MTAKVGLLPAALIVLVALILGWGAGVGMTRGTADPDVLSASLASELADAGVYANALALTARNEPERARRLLEQRLDRSVLHIEALLSRGARLEGSAPSLVESTRRAAAYWSTSGHPARQARAERVVAALERG